MCCLKRSLERSELKTTVVRLRGNRNRHTGASHVVMIVSFGVLSYANSVLKCCGAAGLVWLGFG